MSITILLPIGPGRLKKQPGAEKQAKASQGMFGIEVTFMTFL